MRTIMVLMDTFRRDNLTCYNPDSDLITPNIDEFAKNSTVFDNHWIGSAPCMPARRDIFTGRMNFLERSWGPIEAYDITLPSILKDNDIFTHISTDHCHYMRLGGEGYLQMFNTWDYIRGQEGDPWVSSIDDPLNIPNTYYGRYRRQYQLNRKKWENRPDEYPSPKTFKSGIDWLNKNGKKDNYFLMVEAFDPHEPFDVPEKYLDMYPEIKLDRDYFEIPRYGQNDYGKNPTDYLKTRYKALVTMADHYFGELIDKIKDLGIYDDSLIIFATDHGFLLGDHDMVGKNVVPLFNELAFLPLIVHFPNKKLGGNRIEKLTQNIDIMPTILDFNNIKIPDTVKGKSWKAIYDGEDYYRDFALFGYHGLQMNVTDGRYVYLKTFNNENKPLYEYSTSLTGIRGYLGKENPEDIEFGHFIERSEYPVYKIPINIPRQIASEKKVKLDLLRKSYIFDNKMDKKQEHNLYSDSNLREKMNKLMVKAMKFHDAPKEQFIRMQLEES